MYGFGGARKKKKGLGLRARVVEGVYSMVRGRSERQARRGGSAEKAGRSHMGQARASDGYLHQSQTPPRQMGPLGSGRSVDHWPTCGRNRGRGAMRGGAKAAAKATIAINLSMAML
mgnify:CR=1 FL=1